MHKVCKAPFCPLLALKSPAAAPLFPNHHKRIWGFLLFAKWLPRLAMVTSSVFTGRTRNHSSLPLPFPFPFSLPLSFLFLFPFPFLKKPVISQNIENLSYLISLSTKMDECVFIFLGKLFNSLFYHYFYLGLPVYELGSVHLQNRCLMTGFMLFIQGSFYHTLIRAQNCQRTPHTQWETLQ